MKTLSKHFSYSISDVDYEYAMRAYDAISFYPERRAKAIQNEYIKDMKNFSEKIFDKIGNSEEIIADLEKFRCKYLEKLNAWISAQSRTMSSMITGPANFPVSKNRSKCDIADKKFTELVDFYNGSTAYFLKKYNYYKKGTSMNPISSDDDNAIELLKLKVSNLEDLQAQMKKANSIVRSKKLTEDEQTQKLLEIGFDEKTINEIKIPRWEGLPKGFPSFRLTNNNAAIKTAKQRIAKLERQSQEITSEKSINGIRILDNTEDNRLQIFFDGKPSEDIRKDLKSNGFRWSPRNGCWQSYRSLRANNKAETIVANI